MEFHGIHFIFNGVQLSSTMVLNGIQLNIVINFMVILNGLHVNSMLCSMRLNVCNKIPCIQCYIDVFIIFSAILLHPL